LWSFLTHLIFDHLAFLQHWRLFYTVLDDLPLAPIPTGNIIELLGPQPTRMKLALARRLSKGQVYGLPNGGKPVELHPFGVFGHPTLIQRSAGGESTCSRLPEELLLLSLQDDKQVLFKGSCTGMVVPRNDLADLIKRAKDDADRRLARRWPEAHWGYVCLNVEKMRDLNVAVGFETGDRLLAALDQAAAAFSSACCLQWGAPRLFPFWRQADMLLMPFTYSPSLVPASGLLPMVMATLGQMIVAALRNWKDAPRPRFNVMMESLIFQAGKPSLHSFGQSILSSVEAARNQCKILRLQPLIDRCSVLWLARDPQAGVWRYCAEREFHRNSTAAFALIRRQVKREWKFLLCWNLKHGGFNFPGGHMENQDAGNPRLTMSRELREELGLTVDEAEAQAVFDGPLRALRESEPNDHLTAYEHFFYLLDGQNLRPGAKATVRWEWASLAEFQSGVTIRGKPIRRFPFELLQPIIARLKKANLPLSAAANSDCEWQAIPPSAPQSSTILAKNIAGSEAAKLIADSSISASINISDT
jgi:8-oxo-dGTP pyrophosphatase MutT (NUDIX family)